MTAQETESLSAAGPVVENLMHRYLILREGHLDEHCWLIAGEVGVMPTNVTC